MKSGNMIPLALFFLKIFWLLEGLLRLHTKFKIICSSSMKDTMGNLIAIALNVWIA